MSTTLSKNCVGARLSSPRLHSETAPPQQGPRSPCQCTATVEFLWFPEQDHRNLSLHHDRDVDDLVRIIDKLQLRNLHSFLHCHNPAPVVIQQRASQPCPRTTPVGSRWSSVQFALWEHVSALITGMSTTLSMNWSWDISTFTHGLLELVAA